MHATRLPNDSPRPRALRVWLSLSIACATVIAIFSVPALSTEPRLAPIIRVPHEPLPRVTERAEPRRLNVEANPIPLERPATSQAAPAVAEPDSQKAAAALSSFIRVDPREVGAKPQFARTPLAAKTPVTMPVVPPQTSRIEASDVLYRKQFMATSGNRLARQTSQAIQQGPSDELAQRLVAALAAMTSGRLAATASVSEQQAVPAQVPRQGVIQAVPFDPTRPTTAITSPSDLAGANHGLAAIVPADADASAERQLPPVINLKPVKLLPRQPLIVLAPQSPTASNQRQSANKPQPNEQPSAEKVAKAAPIDVAPSQTRSKASPLAQAVNVPRSKPVVKLAEAPRLESASKKVVRDEPATDESDTDLPAGGLATAEPAKSKTAPSVQPQPSLAVTRQPIVQFATDTALATSLQSEDTQPAEGEFGAEAPAGDAPLEEIAPARDGLKPISSVFVGVAPKAGDMPQDYASTRFARAGQVAHRMGVSRDTAESMVMWEAPAVCYRPLYFEDVNVERYGYKVPLVQPMLSAAHFFGRAPLLPYMMLTERSRECGYSLGHYRPGDYAPYSLYIPKPRLDATAVEATAVLGLILAFP